MYTEQSSTYSRIRTSNVEIFLNFAVNCKYVNLRAAHNLLTLALYCVKLNPEVIKRGLSGENNDNLR